MDDADDVAGLLFINRQPGMKAGGHFFADFVERGHEINAFDVLARRHDVFDSDVFQVKQIDKDGAVLGGDELAGFDDHRAQFVGGQMRCIGQPLGLDAHQLEQAAREQIDEPDHGINDTQQRPQKEGQHRCNPVGVGGGNYLWCNFRAHQDDKGGE